jgi:hypothetical protein
MTGRIRPLSIHPATTMARTLTALLHIIMPSLAQAYRPELFYMRGPGPKSRAK